MALQTPMLRQYAGIKAQYQDCILFYRLGDFYEMFFDDAKVASKILDIALTSRNKGEAEPVPLCGIPYHSCEPYIAKLLEAGKKVAICEQLEEAQVGKGIVRREVVRVVTPGMVFDDAVLEGGRPNYLAALCGEKEFGLAYLDISTAEFRAGSVASFETLLDELCKLDPKEILIPTSWEGKFKTILERHFPQALLLTIKDAEFESVIPEGAVIPAKAGISDPRFHGDDKLHGLSELQPMAQKSVGALYSYACFHQKKEL
ncbi:MAG: hypothetical protein Q7S68_03955, partial [Deltaproteobacteria bacterium]|nr:hypothetical protein [Deltaproteobacteria bacterium]